MSGLSLQEPWKVYRGVLKRPVAAEDVENFAERFGELSRRDGGIGAWPVKPRKKSEIAYTLTLNWVVCLALLRAFNP